MVKTDRYVIYNKNIMDIVYPDFYPSKADVIYSDPPWGAGLLSWWATLNHKDTGASVRKLSLDAFLDKFFGIVKDASTSDTVIYLEYGLRWQPDIMRYASKIGLTLQSLYTPIYRSGSKFLPFHLYVFSYRSLWFPLPDEQAINKTHGYTTVQSVTSTFPKSDNQVLFDPCCGKGYSAQLAIDTGMRFYGNELNEKRLQSTLRRFSK